VIPRVLYIYIYGFWSSFIWFLWNMQRYKTYNFVVQLSTWTCHKCLFQKCWKFHDNRVINDWQELKNIWIHMKYIWGNISMWKYFWHRVIYEQLCAYIFGTILLGICRRASAVCGQKYCNMYKNPYNLYNQPQPYFFKKLLWSHFWIDFNKFYTKTFRIVYILIVYLLIMFMSGFYL
jgi:hypothetical protein